MRLLDESLGKADTFIESVTLFGQPKVEGKSRDATKIAKRKLRGNLKLEFRLEIAIVNSCCESDFRGSRLPESDISDKADSTRSEARLRTVRNGNGNGHTRELTQRGSGFTDWDLGITPAEENGTEQERE